MTSMTNWSGRWRFPADTGWLHSALAELGQDRFWAGASTAFRYFDLGASFVWAMSGALLAAQRGYDITGIFAIALVSATGGGLLRDALFLQQGPPAMARSSAYLLITGVAAILTWSLGRRLQGWLASSRVVAITDAIGLGAFAVVGVQLSTAAALNPISAALIGVINAVGGGVLRSLLLRRTPEVFRPGEFTALAALGGCLTYLLLVRSVGMDQRWAATASLLVVLGLRWVSVRYRLHTLPAYGFSQILRKPSRRPSE